MSEILVNKLTGTSTAGSILVTGEGNSTTTNLQQGLIKVWSNHSNLSAVTIHDSLNVSSMIDQSLGLTELVYANNFSNAVYSGTAAATQNSNVTWRNYNSNYLSGSNQIVTQDNNANGQDEDYIGVHFTGDLA
jgi:hypothetical protein